MASVLATAPRTKYLDFYDGAGIAPEKVSKFLGLTKEDLVEVLGVSKNRIRYDGRISEDLKSYFDDLAWACERVAEVFRGDTLKTEMWFVTSNPLMGNISPREMIRRGRLRKLMTFIQNA